ncbi:MAG: hypothetical protein JRF64_04095 [Deltaproteobacteria bacterium]|nr:hypothetical protein [Deltaproteobacteria bacterium]
MSKAAQARPPRLSLSDGGQGFSSRRTDRTADGLFKSRRRKPAENAAHREKGHLWMETN